MYTTISETDHNTELHTIFLNHNDFGIRATMDYYKAYISNKLSIVHHPKNICIQLVFYPVVTDIPTTAGIDSMMSDALRFTVSWYNNELYEINSEMYIQLHNSMNRTITESAKFVPIREPHTTDTLAHLYDIVDELMGYARELWISNDDSSSDRINRLMGYQAD